MIKIQCIGLITIVRREVSRVFRIWPQTLMPSVITITLYFLIFGAFIGQKIGLIKDVSYMTFILPGLILLPIITNSFANVASTFFSAKFQKNIEELLVSPLDEVTILLGYISGGIVRGALVGCLVMGVASFFWTGSIHHIGLVIITGILTTLLFSIGGLINGIFARKFDDISVIPTFILTPLSYLGGVFYSIDLLPPFWQKVTLFNPILYLINIFRFGFIGVTDIPIKGAFFVLIGLVITLFLISVYLLKKGYGIRT